MPDCRCNYRRAFYYLFLDYETMSYLKKSYCFKNTPTGSAMRVFHGHIKKDTALRHCFSQVVLSTIDISGKGRGDNKTFYAPYFASMRP